MSHLNTVEVACPSCGREQSVHVWESVNVTLNPELRTELMDGKLNSFACRKCGELYQLEHPVLYHDMGRRFAVQYCPESCIDEDGFIAEFLEPGALDLRDEVDEMQTTGKMPKYLMHAHIVFDLCELMRYVKFVERVYGARGKRDLGC